MKIWIPFSMFLLLYCGAVLAQQVPGALSFEVASIKPAAPQQTGIMRVMMNADAGMIRYINVSLKDVIRTAYRVKDFQIDGPDWLSSTRFDIVAKFPAGATRDQVPEMLQSLLTERFKLTFHRDTKEHGIYALVVGKNGAKLKPADVQKPGDPPPPASPGPNAGSALGAGSGPGGDGARSVGAGGAMGPGGSPPRGGAMMMMDPSGMHLKMNAATLASLSDALSRFTERPVVDMTDIKGQYDFDLVFAPESMRDMPRGGPMPPPGAERPAGAEAPQEQGASIFEAIQRYGLKLEPRKAPLETLTIDHIEKTPTEN